MQKGARHSNATIKTLQQTHRLYKSTREAVARKWNKYRVCAGSCVQSSQLMPSVCVLFVTRGPVNSGLKLPTIGNRAHQSIMPPKVTVAPPKPSVRFSDRSVTPMGTTSLVDGCR
jgi:hypothetical protein